MISKSFIAALLVAASFVAHAGIHTIYHKGQSVTSVTVVCSHPDSLATTIYQRSARSVHAQGGLMLDEGCRVL